MNDNFLSSLNPEQNLAATTTDGALLVLSGAGTGKTSVLIARIMYILAQNLAQPWQILILTFTNKAAREIKERLEHGNPRPPFKMPDNVVISDIWSGTFHSICLRILRANAERAGLRQNFLIYGEDEQKSVLKTVITDLGLDPKEYNPADWVDKISAIKDKGLRQVVDKTPQTSNRILDAYNAELARLGAVDFGDLILKVLQLFESAPDVLNKYQRQFKYIMVDEFQDTNSAQMQFLFMLTHQQDARMETTNLAYNICCVGDDDQSIYSWRGAEIKHILDFEKTYPGAKIIRLETNYRSTSNILNAANSLIRHNTGRLGKDLRAAPNVGAGERVYVATLPTDWDEARMIATSINTNHQSPVTNQYSDIAVLIRAGSLSRLFEEEFTTRGIPYRLVGATKFYDRMEIRDAIAYVRLLVHPFDDMSFLRVIGKPRRGFGGVAIDKLRGGGKPFMDTLRTADLSGRQRTAADEFLRAFDFDWDAMRPMDAVERLLENSGYIKMWQDAKDIDAPERIANIKDLLSNVISKYDNLGEFLEHAALMMTDDNDAPDADKNAVNIMTIHAAKGLEFDTVFLPAWEDGIFPNQMAMDAGDLEEERRLAYVAITRARRRAIISNTMSRMVFGERKYNAPGRFIAEMNREFLDIQGCEPYRRPTQSIATSYNRPARKPRPISTSVVGKLAFHDQMGQGVVIEETENILTIAFRTSGIKKVDRKFIKMGDR